MGLTLALISLLGPYSTISHKTNWFRDGLATSFVALCTLTKWTRDMNRICVGHVKIKESLVWSCDSLVMSFVALCTLINWTRDMDRIGVGRVRIKEI